MATETMTKSAFNPKALLNDYPHYSLLAIIILIGFVGIPFSSWVTLTVAGLAMGLMVFVMASGMTLSFGLMHVLNLGHGALITVGAFFGATLVAGLTDGRWPLLMMKDFGWQPSQGLLWGIGIFFIAAALLGLLSTLLGTGAVRTNPKLRGGDHLRQFELTGLSMLAALIVLWIFNGWSGGWVAGLVLAVVALAAGLGVAWAFGARQASKGRDPVYGSATNQYLLGLCGSGLAVVTVYVFANWAWTREFVANLGIVMPAFILGFIAVGIVGYVFERLVIKPVYGDHLKQILVTVGAGIVLAELLQVFWGPDQVNMPRPETLQGGLTIGDVSIEKYRILAVVIGLLIYWGLKRIINGTKIGLLIRAGVENPEMVEAHGYRINLLFIAVFVAGAALAGAGGVMWGLYQASVTVALGNEMLVTIIIVIIIGGLGSIAGCFYAALMVELLNNYMTYIMPEVALFSTIGLMVLVLMWRPMGLSPTSKR